MAAKPLDIWQTPSSTHWQYPPKRIVHLQDLMVTYSRNEPCAHKYLGNCTNLGEQKRTGSRSFTLLERRRIRSGKAERSRTCVRHNTEIPVFPLRGVVADNRCRGRASCTIANLCGDFAAR